MKPKTIEWIKDWWMKPKVHGFQIVLLSRNSIFPRIFGSTTYSKRLMNKKIDEWNQKYTVFKLGYHREIQCFLRFLVPQNTQRLMNKKIDEWNQKYTVYKLGYYRENQYFLWFLVPQNTQIHLRGPAEQTGRLGYYCGNYGGRWLIY